jgi:hypothetical protein
VLFWLGCFNRSTKSSTSIARLKRWCSVVPKILMRRLGRARLLLPSFELPSPKYNFEPMISIQKNKVGLSEKKSALFICAIYLCDLFFLKLIQFISIFV